MTAPNEWPPELAEGILGFTLARFGTFARKAADPRRSLDERAWWLSQACQSLLILHQLSITAPDDHDTQEGGQ
jgi:hypothetical protein